MLQEIISANKLYEKMTVANTDLLDDIAIKVLRNDYPDFLLPMQTINIDGEVNIRYEITNGIRMNYLPMSMSKKELAQLLKNMLTPYSNCEDWLLNYHNFMLDKQYIVVDKEDLAVKYIYIPYGSDLKSNEEIKTFFEDFIMNMDVTDDKGYAMTLFRVLRENKFNLMGLLDTVSKDAVTDSAVTIQPAPKQEQPPVKTPPENKVVTPEKDPVPEVKPVEPAKEVSPFDSLFNDDGDEPAKEKKKFNIFGKKEKEEKTKEEKAKKEKKGLFAKKDKNDTPSDEPVLAPPKMPANNPIKRPSVNEKPPVPQYVEDDNTFIAGSHGRSTDSSIIKLQLVNAGGYDFPQLVELDLSSGSITVGRMDKAGNKRSDFNFNAAFSFISKTHFRVEKDGSNLKIIDMGSTYGTHVNGNRLIPNTPYTLTTGDTILMSEMVSYKVL